MSIGKYSPTISAAYDTDNNWWKKNGNADDSLYDEDGYDEYGYNDNGYDRAGHCELDYALCGQWIEYGTHGKYAYPLFDDTYYGWTFKDGKPCKI